MIKIQIIHQLKKIWIFSLRRTDKIVSKKRRNGNNKSFLISLRILIEINQKRIRYQTKMKFYNRSYSHCQKSMKKWNKSQIVTLSIAMEEQIRNSHHQINHQPMYLQIHLPSLLMKSKKNHYKVKILILVSRSNLSLLQSSLKRKKRKELTSRAKWRMQNMTINNNKISLISINY